MVHIDVSIAGDRGRDNPEWRRQCLESLEDQPVHIHPTAYVPRDLGRARIAGIEQGDSEFIAFVDPDDLVAPGTFDRALEAFAPGVSAYYTNHWTCDEALEQKTTWFRRLAPPVGFAQAAQMHHLVVYRREAIMPYMGVLRGMVQGTEYVLALAALLEGRVVGTPRCDYYWRIHPGGSHHTRYPVPPATVEWVDRARKTLREGGTQ